MSNSKTIEVERRDRDDGTDLYIYTGPARWGYYHLYHRVSISNYDILDDMPVAPEPVLSLGIEPVTPGDLDRYITELQTVSRALWAIREEKHAAFALWLADRQGRSHNWLGRWMAELKRERERKEYEWHDGM